MKKKYVNFGQTDVYAVYYRSVGIIFYNLDFDFTVKIILMK